MQIHQIKNKISRRKKRIGRGGKRGTYSGRGIKGQKSRTGHSQRPTFEGGCSTLVAHTKKNRGFKSRNSKALAISLDRIDKIFKDGEKVNIESLLEKKILKRDKSIFKILSDGELNKKLIFSNSIKVSQKAKLKIEKAGGKFVD